MWQRPQRVVQLAWRLIGVRRRVGVGGERRWSDSLLVCACWLTEGKQAASDCLQLCLQAREHASLDAVNYVLGLQRQSHLRLTFRIFVRCRLCRVQAGACRANDGVAE